MAFIGRSNVGKSSLLNAVVGRRALARTSRTPGKTQQFNYYLINRRLYFVDLPGYGYAKVSRTERERWGEFIGRFIAERQPLQLLIHLVDSRHPPTPLDRDVLDLLKGSDVPYVIALTKADKLSGNDRFKAEKRMKDVLMEYGIEAPVFLTSAQTKRGLPELLKWIDTMTNQ